MKPHRSAVALSVCVAIFILPAVAHGQTFTWDGGGSDDLFGTGANWNPDGAPSVGSLVILLFDGVTRPTPNNNYTAGNDFNEWRLLSTAGTDFAISGNAIGLYGKIENNGGSNHIFTVNTAAIYARDGSIEYNPVGGDINIGAVTYLDGNSTLNVYDGSLNHTLYLNNVLANGNGSGGNGSLILNQTATVVLAADGNTYGTTTINGGTKLQVGNGGATGSLGSDTITDNGQLVFNRSADLTVSNTISGSGTLSEQAANVLTLSGSNSYSGATGINAGTIVISAENNLGATPGSYVSNQLSINGGTLKTATGVSISTNRGITIGSSGATLDNSAAGNSTNFNFNSKITGTGTLTLNANGSTSDSGDGVGGNLGLLNNTSDFTGNVIIQSGVVNFADNGAFGNTANNIVIQGGGLVATGARTLPSTRSIALSGGGNKIFRVYGSTNFTVNGAITGTGNVRHTDGGTLVLTGANSFTGNIDNVRGDLTLSNSAHTGNVTNSSGTLVLNGVNTYTGYTHVNTGTTLRLDADNALPDTTTVLMYGSTTFNANGKTDSFSSLTTGSSSDTTAVINLGSGANLTVTNNSLPSGMTSGYSNATIHGKITGTGNITYNHATTNNGLWDWANTSNDFTGTLTITQGRLRVVTDAALGNAANDIVFNGAPVATFGNQEGKASIQVTNGTDLTLGAGRDVILNAGMEGTMYVWGGTTMTINGKVTGGGNLRKEDSGTLLLNNGADDWTGLTTVVLGEIRIGVAGALSPATTAVVAGGTLNLNGIASSVTGLSGGGQTGGVVSGGSTLTVTGSGTYEYSGQVNDSYGGGNNGLIVEYAGSGSLTLSGTSDNSGGRAAVDSGTLILAKTSSGSVHAVGTNNVPALIINGGICQLGGTGGDQIYTDANVLMTGGTFDLNGRNEGFRGLTGSAGTIRNDGASASMLTIGENSVVADNYIFAGSIANGASVIALTKTSAGTLTLTGTNTYTGATTVNGGTLRVQGSLTNSPTTVLATIAGNGSIGAPLTLRSGAGISSAITNWSGAPHVGFDELAVQSLAFDSGPHPLTVVTTGMVNFNETSKVFPIITTTGGITGFNAPDFTIVVPGFTGTGTWSVRQTSNNLELVYTANAYDSWAASKGLTSANNGKDQDPDGDGRTNLQEFAFDGDPLNPCNDGKIVTVIGDPDGDGPETSALIVTLPVRDGTVFSGPGDLVSDPIDGLIYSIQGSSDLIDFTSMAITEVTPALSAGMPSLSSGWTYRSFRTPGSPADPGHGCNYMRIGVLEAP